MVSINNCWKWLLNAKTAVVKGTVISSQIRMA